MNTDLFAIMSFVTLTDNSLLKTEVTYFIIIISELSLFKGRVKTT